MAHKWFCGGLKYEDDDHKMHKVITIAQWSLMTMALYTVMAFMKSKYP